MRILNPVKRNAFSLLEMVIALALGMVLLLALYMTLSITVNHAESGHEAMADGAVARSIMSRINNDIVSQIGPVDPRMLPNYGGPPINGVATSTSGLPNLMTPGGLPVSGVLDSQNAYTATAGTGMMATPAASSTPSSSTPAASTGTGTTTGSTTTGGTSGNSNSNSSGSTTTAGSGLPAVSYNVGVRGDATSLILSVYRIQRPPVGQPTDVPDPVVISDVTRINYWLIANGSDTLGLARQEIKQATSTDIDLALTDISNPNQYLIADEVKNILFEYFDGTTWQTSWDGTALGGPTGETPIGPPAAIRITLTLRRNTKMTQTVTDNPDDATNTYIQVVPLPTSNNPAPQIAITTSN